MEAREAAERILTAAADGMYLNVEEEFYFEMDPPTALLILRAAHDDEVKSLTEALRNVRSERGRPVEPEVLALARERPGEILKEMSAMLPHLRPDRPGGPLSGDRDYLRERVVSGKGTLNDLTAWSAIFSLMVPNYEKAAEILEKGEG